MSTSSRKRLRIIIVQNCIPHYRLSVFSKLVHDRTFDFSIVAGSRSPDNVRSVPARCFTASRFVFAETYFRELPFGLWVIWQPAAWRFIRRSRADCIVVHGNIYDMTSWLILLWGRLRGIPVLAWTIGLQRREAGFKFGFRRFFYSLARGLLLYGEYPRQLLIEKGAEPTHMHVIYNSLDVSSQRAAECLFKPSELADLRTRHGIDDSARCLMFIGRIVPRKRLSILVEAVARLVIAGHNVHLILIGDGSDVARLKDMTERWKITQRVHFTGAIYDEQVIARYMKLCHAAVVPEAGLPIVHPMGYGVPPIISDNIDRHGTEWEAVEDGKTGFFYKDNDVDDLIASILKCLGNEAERVRVSENCRRRVEERYTSEGHARRIVEGILRLANFEASVVLPNPDSVE